MLERFLFPLAGIGYVRDIVVVNTALLFFLRHLLTLYVLSSTLYAVNTTRIPMRDFFLPENFLPYKSQTGQSSRELFVICQFIKHVSSHVSHFSYVSEVAKVTNLSRNILKLRLLGSKRVRTTRACRVAVTLLAADLIESCECADTHGCH